MNYTYPKIYPLDKLKDALKKAFDEREITPAEYRVQSAQILQKALAIKKWHVEYNFRNPESLNFERKKIYQDVNRFKGMKN